MLQAVPVPFLRVEALIFYIQHRLPASTSAATFFRLTGRPMMYTNFALASFNFPLSGPLFVSTCRSSLYFLSPFYNKSYILTCNPFICVHGYKLPVIPSFNVVRVIVHLLLVAGIVITLFAIAPSSLHKN